MLKAIALGIAAGVVLSVSALAQPLRLPIPDVRPGALIVKHDKDKHGHGKKLGHYKHRDGNDGGWSASRRGQYLSDWSYATPRYHDAPGYGSSLPPAYYMPPAYYGPPPF